MDGGDGAGAEGGGGHAVGAEGVGGLGDLEGVCFECSQHSFGPRVQQVCT